MKKENEETLKEGLEILGFENDSKIIQSFDDYLFALRNYAHSLNITGIRNEREIVIKHFLDSIAPVPILIKENILYDNIDIVDLGSGAGFPGIPIKIVYPKINLTLLEISLKKIVFLEKLINILKIDSEVVNYNDKMSLQKYDIVVSRAFGSLNKIFKVSKTILNRGTIISYKGKIHNIIEETGRKEWQIYSVNVPFLREERCIGILKVSKNEK